MEQSLRPPRLAEIVADVLRTEILDGTLRAGERLDARETLLKRFNVSLPAMRQAIGILEMEGLLVVRRGSVGGAVVQAPKPERIAYMTALVLQSRGATLQVVAETLDLFEPLCAAMCASRSDRHDHLVSDLESIVESERVQLVTDDPSISETSLDFHLAIIENCGNEAMVLMVGSVFALWRAHASDWSRSAHSTGEFSGMLREEAVRAHDRLVAAIGNGDAVEAERLARKYATRSASPQLGHSSIGNHALVTCEVLR